MRRRPVRLILAVLCAAALLLTACGDDDDAAATDGAESPTEAPADGSDDETPTQPPATGDSDESAADAIISLSPTATEILFAIGAGDQVIAVDSLSDYPDEAPVSDLGAFEPNVEAIADLEPDLVVLSFDPGSVVAGLDALGIATIEQAAATSLDASYAQITELGEATGHTEEAAELIAQMQADIDAAVAELPEADEPLTFFHEIDDTLFTVTSSSFIGEIYALAGLENIADAADGAESGFPQLSAEYLLDQDPDLVFLADTKCCGQTVATFGSRAGFDQLTAVETGAVIELDDDIASRWGPRVVLLLEAIVEAATEARAGTG